MRRIWYHLVSELFLHKSCGLNPIIKVVSMTLNVGSESKTMPLDVVIKIPSSPGFLSSPPTTCTSPADLDIERERRETLLDSPPRQRSGSFISQKEWATESLTSFTVQVLTPFLICGFGNLGAGQLLDVVQHWPVFLTVTELYVLVPSLMGLKGNLEMTMASRLSTSVSSGLILNFQSNVAIDFRPIVVS